MEIKTPADKLKMITDAIESGRTVFLVTMTHATKITPKTWKSWDATGRAIVKISLDGKSLLLASGRKYVNANWVTIQIQEK